MILGYFDYIILAILIFLNIKFWKIEFRLKSGCLIGLVLFGFLLPILSIFIELERVKLNGGWMDSFEVVYTIIRFPTYWIIGIIQLIILGINLKYRKAVNIKKNEKLISSYYLNSIIEQKSTITFIKGNFLIFQVDSKIIDEIKIDQIKIIAEYTKSKKNGWFLIVYHFDNSFIKIPFYTKNLIKTISDLNKKLGVTLSLTLFNSSDENSSILYPIEFIGKKLWNFDKKETQDINFELSDLSKRILTE